MTDLIEASKKEAKMFDIYCELSNQAENTNIREILKILIAESEGHKKGLLRKTINRSEVTNSTLVDTAKMFFKKIRSNKDGITISEQQRNLYIQSITFLKKNSSDYKTFGVDESNRYLKDIFFCLAEESHKHCIILEEILDFFDKGSQWLEKSSYGHIDEY